MNISYRKLAAKESKLYRDIRLESLRLHPESFSSVYEEQRELPKLMFEKAIEEPIDDRFVLGAFDSEELIGICGFMPIVSKENPDLSAAGKIIQVYVRAAYRGQKIGLNLVEATIDEAFKLPAIELIILGVMAGNISAIRVYEQAGFEIFDGEGIEGVRSIECDRLMIIRREG